MTAALKHSKGLQVHSYQPTYFTAGTNTKFYMKNGNHLEKWAPNWILK